MSQLSLNLRPCLSYSPDNFVFHAGVVETFERIQKLMKIQGFRICFLYGPSRCGKTHFSIKLADALLKEGQCPRLLDGAGFKEWLAGHRDAVFVPGDVVVVDDIHLYLKDIKPGDSGEFVSFVERLRVAGAALMLLSPVTLESFSFDEHIRSRLEPGSGFEIGNPAPEDLFKLVRQIARQRGLALSERKVDFLERRIGRDISSIESYIGRLQELQRVTGGPVNLALLGDAV